MRPMIICIDFDGTCVEHAFPKVGSEFPYVTEVLKRFTNAGIQIILWTCREDHPTKIDDRFLQHAVDWFKERDIPLYGINETPPEAEFREFEPRRKAYGDIYIDDRQLGGLPMTQEGVPDWLAIEKAVLEQIIVSSTEA